MAGNKFGVKFEYNSWTKHARETKFEPESSWHIPASENWFFMATFCHLHTKNYRQVTILRMFRKRMSNRIFVHSDVKEINVKYVRSNHTQINAGILQVLNHLKARLNGSRFKLIVSLSLICKQRDWSESRANTLKLSKEGLRIKTSKEYIAE